MPLCIFCRFFRGDSTNIPLTSKSVVLYCGIFVVDLLCGCSCTLRKSQIYSQPFRYLMDFKFQCRWWWCTCNSLHSVHTASQPLLYSRFFFHSLHLQCSFLCFVRLLHRLSPFLSDDSYLRSKINKSEIIAFPFLLCYAACIRMTRI